MADHGDVRRVALSLPGVVEGEDRFGCSVLNKGRHAPRDAVKAYDAGK